MSFLEGSNNVIITGGTNIAASGSVTIHQGGQTTTNNSLKELSAHTAHAALYNSAARFDAPRCHRNTRASYLDSLEKWMLGRGYEYDGARLVWLTGGAGAGKSAIMQSIAERAAKHKVVLGSFFFSRTDTSRNYAEVLIPTLAYQLARSFPAAMATLHPTIENDPLIFKASLQVQANELLVRPLQHLIGAGIIDATSAFQIVFVVDGLDECEDPKKQALIIKVIADILCNHGLQVSFLIASRTEVAISQAIQAEARVKSMFATITLGESHEARSDIRQFIVDSFLDICETHPLREHIPENWPSRRSIGRLVAKSSGHFIFAATAIKFILSSDEHPERALRVIEGLEPSRTGSPFAELDALYKHIITSAKYSSQVLRIFGHCCSPSLTNTVTSICFLNPDYSPKDVTLYLSDVHALVSFSLVQAAEIRISFKHASLSDFLGNAQRSELLHIDADDYVASCLPRYFDMFDIDPEAAASKLHHLHDTSLIDISNAWNPAIRKFPDGNLLHRLIGRHTPRQVWNLAKALFMSSNRDAVINFVLNYLRAIRLSAANTHDSSLYAQQFGMFIQFLTDEIRCKAPQYRFIPALLFMSTPSSLKANFPHQLIIQLQNLGLSVSCGVFFTYHVYNHTPEQLSHLWRLPESLHWWGTDLASVIKPVLQHIASNSWVPDYLNAHQHKQWRQQINPLPSQAKGYTKPTGALSTRLFAGLPSPISWRYYIPDAEARLQHAGFSKEAALDIELKRKQCYILLKAVVDYLPKSDCTGEIAVLARRSLPRESELWFPKLAHGARKLMDAYVLRWEASYEGVIEKTRSMLVNDLD